MTSDNLNFDHQTVVDASGLSRMECYVAGIGALRQFLLQCCDDMDEAGIPGLSVEQLRSFIINIDATTEAIP